MVCTVEVCGAPSGAEPVAGSRPLSPTIDPPSINVCGTAGSVVPAVEVSSGCVVAGGSVVATLCDVGVDLTIVDFDGPTVGSATVTTSPDRLLLDDAAIATSAVSATLARATICTDRYHHRRVRRAALRAVPTGRDHVTPGRYAKAALGS